MRILAVRFSAIGDCVMAAWPVTALRLAYPNAFIAWVAEARCVPVIDDERLTTRVVPVPRATWKARRWSPRTWFEQIRLYTGFRSGEPFDLGIDFQGHSKTALLLKLARPTRRFAARATDAFARRLNPIPVPFDPEGPHEVEHYHALCQWLGLADFPERPFMPALPPSPLPPGRWATIQTGAGDDDKRYPAERWDAVAARLRDGGLQVAALGAPGDPRLAEAVNFVGRLTLRQAMAAIAGSAVHLAGDTGSGHIAAALGVPVVSVFGRTDPRRFRPYTARGRTLREGFDTALVDPDAVATAAMELLHAQVSD
jgi:ADP-heptose:LPS heptosyltransferase